MKPFLVKQFCETALKRILMLNGSAPKIKPEEIEQTAEELNLILDSWNADGGMIYTQQFYTFALIPGQQTYSIGPNTAIGGNTVVANFNTGTQPRPSYLEYASFQQVNSNPYSDLPMSIVSAAEWASIVSKNISSSVGFYVYMDEAYPQANLNIWPTPSVAANIVLTTWLSLNSDLAITDYFSAPPAYSRAISLELSIAMAPYYGKSGDASVAQLASQVTKIKKNISWNNIRGGLVTYSDGAQGSRGLGGRYDAISGETT